MDVMKKSDSKVLAGYHEKAAASTDTDIANDRLANEK